MLRAAVVPAIPIVRERMPEQHYLYLCLAQARPWGPCVVSQVPWYLRKHSSRLCYDWSSNNAAEFASLCMHEQLVPCTDYLLTWCVRGNSSLDHLQPEHSWQAVYACCNLHCAEQGI